MRISPALSALLCPLLFFLPSLPAPSQTAPLPATAATAPAATTVAPPQAAPATPAATPAAAAAPVDPKAEAAKAVEKRRDTIRYGIESEILDLLKALGAEGDNRYNADLLGLFQGSASPKLRIAVLELWKTLAWSGGEDAALAVVKGRDEGSDQAVAAALGYLAEIKSKKALDLAPTLIEENNKALLPSLIALLGRAGSSKEEDILLAWLKGDAPTPALKEAAIKALGDIGSKKAAESLAKILADGGSTRFERVYAAEALGKIGWDQGLEALVKAANGEDPTVRVAAIEAIGSFKGRTADTALVEALRDSFAKCRIAACKALGKRNYAEAVPNLKYKASSDPDKGVKAEALRALAAIGGEDCLAFLEAVMTDKKGDAAGRILAFGLLARKGMPGREKTLLAFFAGEAAVTDRSFYTSLVRELAAAGEAKEAAPLARLVLADKDYLIRLGGLEWARASKVPAIKPDLERLAASDPNEAVRRRAAEILGEFSAQSR